MRNEEFTNGETPFDSGDFNTLAEITSLLRKLHSPFALNIEKTYNRLQFLEDKEKIEEGVRAANNGELIDHEEVVKQFVDYDKFRADLKAAIKEANRKYQKVTTIYINADEYKTRKTNRFLDIPVYGDEEVPSGMFRLETESTVLMMNQSDVR